MGLFSRKALTSDEYSDLSSKIVKLNTDVAILKGEFEKIETRFKSLHTKIARTSREEDEETENSEMDLVQTQRRLMGLQ